jgi:hypothetical protein
MYLDLRIVARAPVRVKNYPTPRLTGPLPGPLQEKWLDYTELAYNADSVSPN